MKNSYKKRDEEFVEYFNSIISATSTHEGVDKEASQFQKHKHKDLCYKSKNCTIKIGESEGYGANPLGWRGDPLEVQKF